MRILLAAALLAIATPVWAVSAENRAKVDAQLAWQNNYNAARAKERAAEHAAVASRCAKIGGAKVGLTAEGVRKSCWGRPMQINTTTTAHGTHEQWVYGGGYVYLDDGVVTAIQTSR